MSRALGGGGETVLSVGGGTLRGWRSVTCREWGGELSSGGGGLGGGPGALGVVGVAPQRDGSVLACELGGEGGGCGGGWVGGGVGVGGWGDGGGSGRSEVFEVSKRSFGVCGGTGEGWAGSVAMGGERGVVSGVAEGWGAGGAVP